MNAEQFAIETIIQSLSQAGPAFAGLLAEYESKWKLLNIHRDVLIEVRRPSTSYRCGNILGVIEEYPTEWEQYLEKADGNLEEALKDFLWDLAEEIADSDLAPWGFRETGWDYDDVDVYIPPEAYRSVQERVHALPRTPEPVDPRQLRLV